jgi:hypothetical protein
MDRALLYLFSYDVESNVDQERIGFVPGGVRANVHAYPARTRVYHVLRDRTIGGIGTKAISGTLAWGGDRLFLREDDIEFSDVELRILTDDGATIELSYSLVADLGPGSFRRLVSNDDKLGTPRTPVDWPVLITPKFETANPEYRWLMDYQGVGFGRVRVIKNDVRRLTYDIYAMT